MKKIIIIGAGPAGLTAGYELLKQGNTEFSVTIFEESEEIGGISRTVKHNGNRMDIGGHRFFSKDDKVTKWWESIMPLQGAPAYDDKCLGRNVSYAEGGSDPEKTDAVMLKRNRVSRIYYRRKFFDYPVKLNWNTIKNMGFLTTIRAGFSYLFSVVHKRDEESLEGFYENRFGHKLYTMFFEGYTEKLWGRHPSEISAEWGAQRVKGLSVIAIIKDIFRKMIPAKKNAAVETSLIEEFSYPKYGPGQLWETVAEQYEKMGGTIRKGCSVREVLKEHNHVTGIAYRDEKGELREETADVVISSMPLKDLVVGFQEVPKKIKEIAEGLPYRDFVTVGLLIDRLKLKNQTKLKTLGNIIPDCWIYVQDVSVKLGRIQIFNNWSPYMVTDPDHMVWIGLEYFCTEGDQYWCMSEEEWKEFGISELKKIGVIDDRTDVLDAHMERVKKAYPAYFDTYENIDSVIEYLNQIDNLYCVGRNGQHRYNNMDHSMATAFEAVTNIITGKGDKAAIWNVNTEKEYHEEK